MAAKKAQSDLLESLSDFVKRVEKHTPLFDTKKVIVSSDIKVKPFKEDHGIVKTPIVWPLWDYKMFYIVEVPAGEVVPSHSHDEAIFRVLISGSLTINGRTIDTPGTWYVVPALTPYKITTKTGYMALSGYTSNCMTNRNQALADLRKKTSRPRT